VKRLRHIAEKIETNTLGSTIFFSKFLLFMRQCGIIL